MVATQLTISDIADALNRYGTPGDVLAIMLRTPPHQMYFFSPDEVVKYGLNRTAIYPDAGAILPAPTTPNTPPSLSPEQKALAFLSEILNAHATATAATATTVTRYYAKNLTYFGRPATLRSV